MSGREKNLMMRARIEFLKIERIRVIWDKKTAGYLSYRGHLFKFGFERLSGKRECRWIDMTGL